MIEWERVDGWGWNPPHLDIGGGAHVEALIFSNNAGFREKDRTFTDVEEMTDSGPGYPCWKARCVRTIAWQYAQLGLREYDMFGQINPNSNSFLGVIASICNLGVPNGVGHPRRNRGAGRLPEGEYPGWHYWAESGKDWRLHND